MISTSSPSFVPESSLSKSPIEVLQVIFYQNTLISSQRVIKEFESEYLIKTYNLYASNEPDVKSVVDINQDYFLPSSLTIESLDILLIPRLDWDDRHIQYDISQSMVSQSITQVSPTTDQAPEKAKLSLPKKIIVAGNYSSVLNKHSASYPFVGFLDTDQWFKKRQLNSNYRQPLFADQTMLKCFTIESQQSWFGKAAETSHDKVKITAVNFGPYDNGHVMIGFNTGHILVLNSFDLSSMFRLQAFDSKQFPVQEISSICFDPTQMMLVSSKEKSK